MYLGISEVMKGELTMMMRASEEKHFSKPTRLTNFYFLKNLFIYLFLFIYLLLFQKYFWGVGGNFVEYLGKYIFF